MTATLGKARAQGISDDEYISRLISLREYFPYSFRTVVEGELRLTLAALLPLAMSSVKENELLQRAKDIVAREWEEPVHVALLVESAYLPRSHRRKQTPWEYFATSQFPCWRVKGSLQNESSGATWRWDYISSCCGALPSTLYGSGPAFSAAGSAAPFGGGGRVLASCAVCGKEEYVPSRLNVERLELSDFFRAWLLAERAAGPLDVELQAHELSLLTEKLLEGESD